jgi:DNA-binding transcriptional ArsR family regulator
VEDRLQSEQCAERLKALADPDRLKIIQCLRDGPKAVSDLAGLLDTTLALASHHVRVLYRARLVRYDKQGHYVVYSLCPDIFRPASPRRPNDLIDLGCCRLHLGQAWRSDARGSL